MTESPIFGNASELLNTFLEKQAYSQIFILTDENTDRYCFPVIKDVLPSSVNQIIIDSGEENKTMSTCDVIWEVMTQAGADRNVIFINLGGGVIGDMGGFSASLYKRGVRFINLPTTLLSQVDASVGGKLGVDFNGLKNHIGLFKEPETVIVDFQFLKTLPERQIKSGFAEIIKHSLIRSEEQWNEIQQPFDDLHWESIIPSSVAIKKEIVDSDFLESGERKLLNFGHTIGHAVETFLISQKVEIYHGEAVAAGMIMESFLSHQKNLLDSTPMNDIIGYIDHVFNRVSLDVEDFPEIMELCKQDKKNRNNKVLMTGLNGIGKSQWDVEITEEEIQQALNFYSRVD